MTAEAFNLPPGTVMSVGNVLDVPHNCPSEKAQKVRLRSVCAAFHETSSAVTSRSPRNAVRRHPM